MDKTIQDFLERGGKIVVCKTKAPPQGRKDLDC